MDRFLFRIFIVTILLFVYISGDSYALQNRNPKIKYPHKCTAGDYCCFIDRPNRFIFVFTGKLRFAKQDSCS